MYMIIANIMCVYMLYYYSNRLQYCTLQRDTVVRYFQLPVVLSYISR